MVLSAGLALDIASWSIDNKLLALRETSSCYEPQVALRSFLQPAHTYLPLGASSAQ